MDCMFCYNNSFDQDLSSWCVTNISNPAQSFNLSSSLTDENLPIWGQCGEIYLDDNGVTIKARDNAVVGESYKLTNEGDSYKVVDETMLREMVAADEDVSKVITTKIANFENLFQNKTTFDDNISSWDLSNATNLKGTFRGATNFNQDISKWNTSKVIIMASTFNDATNFDQDISEWDTSKVLYMDYMFKGAISFDQDISGWNVGNVTSMYQMFSSGSTFNQPIGSWDVSNVTNMGEMFGNNTAFNQNLNSWDVSNVRNMAWMFNSAIFNQPIGDWDVSNVTDMNHMFRFNSKFNQDIGNWDVSSVLNFSNAFVGARAFNQDISSWNVSSATNMDGMFWEAVKLNQDLSSWCVSNIDSEPTRFAETTAMLVDNLPVWGTCPDGSKGLIAYYPFNGNASDETGNGNDGTVVGAILTTDRHGNENSAYYFGDNCEDRVDANIDTSAIDTSEAFSFSIWYYYSGDGCVSPRLFEFWPGSNNLTRFVAGGERDNLPFIYLGVSGSNTGSSWVSKPNQWTHLVFTVDSSSFAVYQDGELIGSGETDVNPIELPGDVAFGRMNHAAWDGIEGKLDDIRLYDIKLSPSQVQLLFEETTSSNHNSGGSGGGGAGSTGS